MKPKPADVVDYGTSRRRTPWIKIGIVCCLAAAALGTYWQRVPLLRWWSLVQLRREVLVSDVPAGTILFHQRAADTRQSILDSLGGGGRRPVTPRDRMEGRLLPIRLAGTGDPWTVFLHQRWTPGGKHRVVLVEANASVFGEMTVVRLSAQLFDAGSVLRPRFTTLTVRAAEDPRTGTIPGFPGALSPVANVSHGSDFRLLAGRPDPVDRSAFLVDVTGNGKVVTLTGRIGDDESLTWSTSDGSALPLLVTPAAEPAVGNP